MTFVLGQFALDWAGSVPTSGETIVLGIRGPGLLPIDARDPVGPSIDRLRWLPCLVVTLPIVLGPRLQGLEIEEDLFSASPRVVRCVGRFAK